MALQGDLISSIHEFGHLEMRDVDCMAKAWKIQMYRKKQGLPLEFHVVHVCISIFFHNHASRSHLTGLESTNWSSAEKRDEVRMFESVLFFQKKSIQILDIEKWQPLPLSFSPQLLTAFTFCVAQTAFLHYNVKILNIFRLKLLQYN